MTSRQRWNPWAATCAFAVVFACTPEAPPNLAAPVREAIEVTAHTAALGSVQRYVRATGTLFGEEETRVSAKVAGRIDAVYCDVGAVLKPGQPLARVEPTDYALAVTERRRAFEQALAAIGLDALPGEDFELDKLPAVERAHLQAENSRARYERAELLHKRTPPAVSDQDFADFRTTWDVAQADERLAVLNARAQLAQARALQAQLASAQQRLDDTTVAAPRGERPPVAEIEGLPPPSIEFVVTRRAISVGDYVQIGAPLFELVDPDPLELRVAVPEREAPRVHLGQSAKLSVDAYSREFVGRVARINPAVEARTRTFEVEIVVQNGDRALRAGSFARVSIEVERDASVLLVPKSAVATFAGVHKVFAIVDGKAVERVVSLGVDEGEQVEILRGLEPGESLVAEVKPGLTGGAPVRVAAP